MALAPDSGLHDALVSKAIALAEHYQSNSTERKWWKHLRVRDSLEDRVIMI
jgi:hypothetical protein